MPATTPKAADLEQAARLSQIIADTRVKDQAHALEPKRLILQALTAGAAIFGAGAAFATALAGVITLIVKTWA